MHEASANADVAFFTRWAPYPVAIIFFTDPGFSLVPALAPAARRASEKASL
jgi:hypothetical protein